MPERSIREIIFMPENMALTFVSGILLGLILGVVIQYLNNSQYFFHILILIGVVFLIEFSIMFQFNIDQFEKLRLNCLRVKLFLRDRYRNTIFYHFDDSDWIFFIWGVILLFGSISFFLNIRDLIELSKKEPAILPLVISLMGLSLSLIVFSFSMIDRFMSDVKGRLKHNQIIDRFDQLMDQYLFIKQKLDEMEEKNVKK